MIWTDGSIYYGDWKGGIQHGMGRMVFPDGSTKEGLFENNVFKQEIQKSLAHSKSAIQTKVRSEHSPG
jgi:hypothetical protein